jgi:glutamine amidotransferase
VAAVALRKPVVGIVDYKAGNVQSIENAFDHVGAEVRRVRDHADLEPCSHVVLPGVGAFGFCAGKLAASGMLPALEEWAFGRKRPLLGICVGMQLLADSSEESPEAAGLGWMGGKVARIASSAGIRVPHVGWNAVTFEQPWGSFEAGSSADFYFDHSFAYGLPARGSAVATCLHGERFSVVLERDNIVAVQFHPEKSQTSGLRLLSSFLSR